jgi:hypothetical protein
MSTAGNLDLDTSVADLQRRLHETETALKSTRRQLRAVRSSASYRVGNTVVRVAKAPASGGKRSVARVLRLLARVTPERWRRSLPAPLRSVVFRLTRSGSAGTTTESTATQQRGGRTKGGSQRQPSGLLAAREAVEGPVQVFVALGLDDEARERLVAEVVALHEMAGGFVPVFVTDDADFAAFRRRGVLFEYVTPAQDWAAHADPIEWPRYFDARIRGIVRHYQPRQVFVLGDWRGEFLSGRTYLWPLLVPEA